MTQCDLRYERITLTAVWKREHIEEVKEGDQIKVYSSNLNSSRSREPLFNRFDVVRFTLELTKYQLLVLLSQIYFSFIIHLVFA